MYVNLHDLPPDQAMFTLYIGLPGDPFETTEEYDQVAPNRAPHPTYLTSTVIQAARDALVNLYGDDVEVRGVANQSEGHIMFDCRLEGFRPIPVVPTERLAQMFDRPYDAVIDLCTDQRDGLGGAEYLDYLLER